MNFLLTHIHHLIPWFYRMEEIWIPRAAVNWQNKVVAYEMLASQKVIARTTKKKWIDSILPVRIWSTISWWYSPTHIFFFVIFTNTYLCAHQFPSLKIRFLRTNHQLNLVKKNMFECKLASLIRNSAHVSRNLMQVFGKRLHLLDFDQKGTLKLCFKKLMESFCNIMWACFLVFHHQDGVWNDGKILRIQPIFFFFFKWVMNELRSPFLYVLIIQVVQGLMPYALWRPP